jgi:hypothetical protein
MQLTLIRLPSQDVCHCFSTASQKEGLGKSCQKQFHGLSEQYAVLQTPCEGSLALIFYALALTEYFMR